MVECGHRELERRWEAPVVLRMVGCGGRVSGVRPQMLALCGFEEWGRGSTSIGGVATWSGRWREVTFDALNLGGAEDGGVFSEVVQCGVVIGDGGGYEWACLAGAPAVMCVIYGCHHRTSADQVVCCPTIIEPPQVCSPRVY